LGNIMRAKLNRFNPVFGFVMVEPADFSAQDTFPAGAEILGIPLQHQQQASPEYSSRSIGALRSQFALLPETFVIILYHYHLDGPISIPIGFMSTKREHLATARDFIVNEVIGQRTVYDLSSPTGGLGKDCTETLSCFAPYER
jgi:hypothetical protein